MSTYPRRPKAEAFSNAVDVVERVHDRSDRTSKCRRRRSQTELPDDDVPHALGLVEDEGEFRQHDDMATVMMMLPAQGFT